MCMCTFLYIYTYIYIPVHIHTHRHTHLHIQVHSHTHAHAHSLMYVCSFPYAYAYRYQHAWILLKSQLGVPSLIMCVCIQNFLLSADDVDCLHLLQTSANRVSLQSGKTLCTYVYCIVMYVRCIVYTQRRTLAKSGLPEWVPICVCRALMPIIVGPVASKTR